MDLTISKKNEVFLKIDSKEPHIFCELSDIFTFEVPGAKFMPQYRNKYWDGKIRLFNQANGEIYVGLLDKIISFVKSLTISMSLYIVISMVHLLRRMDSFL